MKKILVLGGCGFIGSHVAEVFVKNNYPVYIIDNLSTGKLENKPQKAKFYNLDLRNREKLDKIFKEIKPDVISHHASGLVGVQESVDDPKKAFSDLEITANVVELAKKHKIKHIIFSSSANVYAKGELVPISEESNINPISPYGITKLAIESYLNYSSVFGLKVTIFRYFNVYGPRQSFEKVGGIVPVLINSLSKNSKALIFGGNQTRDFIYAEDIAYANFLASKKGVAGIYNVGSGEGISINNLINILEKLTNQKLNITRRKKFTEIDDSVADISKIKNSLGWKPQISLEKGLIKTIEFYKLSR